MRTLKIFATAALAALSLSALAPVAFAHEQGGVHRVRWGGDAPGDGERMFGTDFVTATADMNDGVGRWRIEMKPVSGAAPFFCETDVPGKPRELDFRCDWDTAKSGSVVNGNPSGAGFSVNGKYVITVTVWNAGSDGGLLSRPMPPEAHVLQPTRTVTVENPVSAPTGVVRGFDSGSRTATISWNANPEPDVEKYVIEESGDGGKTWSKAGERPGGSTSFQRPIERPGTYQYRVAALRPEVKQSGWSVTDPLEVAAAPLSPPTTAGGGQAPADGDPGAPFVPGAPPGPPPAPSGAPPSPRPNKPLFGTGTGGAFSFTLPSSRPSVPSAGRPQVTTTTEFDPGYSDKLPYKARTNGASSDGDQPELAGGDEEGPQTMTRLVRIPRPRDPRALLVPLAAGLALFVFSMQVTHFLRRRPALAAAEDDLGHLSDFGDWTGGF
jgi:hypothetical protein